MWCEISIRLAENDHITILIILLYIHDIRPIICDPYWSSPRYLTPHVSKVEQVRDMILIRFCQIEIITCYDFRIITMFGSSLPQLFVGGRMSYIRFFSVCLSIVVASVMKWLAMVRS
jgi:hypothetical protein